MPRNRAWGLAASGTLLASSGAAMFVFRYVAPARDPFSAYPHAWWPRLVLAHVLAAPAFFFYAGSIWWTHVVRNWRLGRRRLGGAALVAAAAAMAGTGYALYFVGGEFAVSLVRISHAATGALFVLLYAVHAVVGFRSLARR